MQIDMMAWIWYSITLWWTNSSAVWNQFRDFSQVAFSVKSPTTLGRNFLCKILQTDVFRQLSCLRYLKLQQKTHCDVWTSECWLIPGAYTSGVLGVRRTPCETEHDVTFSRSCDQRKITKKLCEIRAMKIIMYFPARTCAPNICSRLLSYSKRHLRKPQTAFAVVSCAVPTSGAEWILLPCFLLSDKTGCTTFQAHICRGRKLVIDKIFAQSRSLFLQLWASLFQGWV